MKLGEEDGNKGQQPRAVQLPQTEGQGLKVEVAELRERGALLELTVLDMATKEEELVKRIEGLELTILDMAAKEEMRVDTLPEG